MPQSTQRRRTLCCIGISLCLCVCGLAFTQCTRALSSRGVPKSNPTLLYDSELVEACRNQDTPRIEKHVHRRICEIWSLKGSRPKWEHWATKYDILSQANLSTPEFAGQLPPPDEAAESLSNSVNSALAQQRLYVVVHYDQRSAAHVRRLLASSTLQDIHNTGTVDIAQHHKYGFPEQSVIIKTIWWPIPRVDDPMYPTPVVPAWDGPVADARAGINCEQDPFGNDYTRWKSWIAIDDKPNAHAASPPRCVEFPAWATSTDLDTVRHELEVIPAARVHIRRIGDAPQLFKDRQWRQRAFSLWDRNGHDDERMLLVGMHIMVKDVPDWLWITMWLSERRVKEVGACGHDLWRNYELRFTYLEDTQDGAYPTQGTRPVFNPWLEAPISNGINSNCVACHQHAAWIEPTKNTSAVAKLRAAATRVSDGLPSSDYLADLLQLDYVWSLAHGVRVSD